MDYFLKSSEVFKLREFVNLSQSPVFQYRINIFIDSLMILLLLLLLLFFFFRFLYFFA